MTIRALSSATAALSLVAASPLAAQEEEAAQEEQAQAQAPSFAEEELGEDELGAFGDLFAGLFGDMFGEAEPLTEEQEARMPMAMQVVAKLFPEGTYAQMMDETMKPMFDGIMGGIGGSPALLLSDITGIDPITLNQIDKEDLEQALDLLDPQAEMRNDAIAGLTMELMVDVVADIEPSYRMGLARAYAIRFTAEELTGLDAFFATELGGKYAAESFLIYADPQVMSAMNEMMPAVMEKMPEMMVGIFALMEEFPEGRSFSELDASERSLLADLLGVTEQELADNEPVGEDEFLQTEPGET